TYGVAFGTASLTVTQEEDNDNPTGRIVKLRLEPAEATIPLGSSQTYRAYGLDPHDNVVAEVTADTTFSMPANRGSCSGNVCTPNRVANNITIQGDWTNKNATAKLHVVEAGATQTAQTAGGQAEEPDNASHGAPAVVVDPAPAAGSVVTPPEPTTTVVPPAPEPETPPALPIPPPHTLPAIEPVSARPGPILLPPALPATGGNTPDSAAAKNCDTVLTRTPALGLPGDCETSDGE
ncbi:MAG: hypothetical protein ACRDJM_07780, partial [Actinomycetota bacterium]